MNVAELFFEQAKLHPNKLAIKAKNKGHDFQTLAGRIDSFCHRFIELGIKPGYKVLFFVKPNEDFAGITFALFKMGAIPVFIDPGMKKEYFLKCLKDVKADALIGIKRVHLLFNLHKKNLTSVKVRINLNSFGFMGSKPLYKNLCLDKYDFYRPKDKDLAAILFTSGGTGAPKGVEYTHDIFISQTKMLQNEFNLTHKDSDIPGFPLFSFFTLSMGMTGYIPSMNPAKPAKTNPKKLYQDIVDNNATFVAGSPAIWSRLADYCDKNSLQLPSVKYMVMFGAPIPKSLHDKFANALPNGTTYTPYGATECLPVANISGKNLKFSNKGICVGKPLDGVEVKIIPQSNNEVTMIDELEVGTVGEIIVHSPNLTKAYYQESEKTKLAKIHDGEKLWHRMGDVGFIDQTGYLWFCGRLKHVVEYKGERLYPVPVETYINSFGGFKKSALIQTKKGPSVVIEGKVNKSEILEYTKKEYSSITDIFEIDKIPVDIRHNIKIDRGHLSKMFWESK